LTTRYLFFAKSGKRANTSVREEKSCISAGQGMYWKKSAETKKQRAGARDSSNHRSRAEKDSPGIPSAIACRRNLKRESQGEEGSSLTAGGKQSE